MKKNTILSLLALSIFLGGTASAFMVKRAAAEELADRPRMQGPMMQDVERTVENIDNGVIITLTSDDPDTIERLQNAPEHPPQGGEPEGVEREVEVLDNGVRFTITSNDPEMVEHIQEHAAREAEGRHRGMPMENVDRTVEKIDNGVLITLTSEDPEIVQMLQEHAEGGFMFQGPAGEEEPAPEEE